MPSALSKTKSISTTPMATKTKKATAVTRGAKSVAKKAPAMSAPVVASTGGLCRTCGHIPMGGPNVLMAIFLVLVFTLSAVLFVAGDVVKKQNEVIAKYRQADPTQSVVMR